MTSTFSSFVFEIPSFNEASSFSFGGDSVFSNPFSDDSPFAVQATEGMNPLEGSTFRSAGPELSADPFDAIPANPMFGALKDDSLLGPLNPVPEYYERFSSAVSAKSPSEVFEDVQCMLDDMKNCDYVPANGKPQIRGLLSEQGKPCLFEISLYDCSGPYNQTGQSGVLVECSRQQGCCMVFNAFFQELAARIEGCERRCGFRAPPCLSEEGADADSVDTSFVQSMVSLALCSHAEARRDGLCALSHMSHDSMTQAYLASTNELTTILLGALGSCDELTKRAGAILLDNLATQQSVKDAMESSLRTVISSCLEDIEDDDTTFVHLIRTQTRRHLTSSLHKMDASASISVI
jgi:hypothetical protein